MGKTCSNKIIIYDTQEVTTGKQHVRATCWKDFYSSPDISKDKYCYSQTTLYGHPLIRTPHY